MKRESIKDHPMTLNQQNKNLPHQEVCYVVNYFTTIQQYSSCKACCFGMSLGFKINVKQALTVLGHPLHGWRSQPS